MDNHSEDFKDAMRRLASTVCLVTAGDHGMAATAVMSLSADPPTLAIAVNRNARLHAVLQEQTLFCVNLLAERHSHLVPSFGGAVKASERFRYGNWIMSDTEPPILEDALASLVCRLTDQMTVATHTLFVGEVVRNYVHQDVDPLIWVNGGCASTNRLC